MSKSHEHTAIGLNDKIKSTVNKGFYFEIKLENSDHNYYSFIKKEKFADGDVGFFETSRILDENKVVLGYHIHKMGPIRPIEEGEEVEETLIIDDIQMGVMQEFKIDIVAGGVRACSPVTYIDGDNKIVGVNHGNFVYVPMDIYPDLSGQPGPPYFGFVKVQQGTYDGWNALVNVSITESTTWNHNDKVAFETATFWPFRLAYHLLAGPNYT